MHDLLTPFVTEPALKSCISTHKKLTFLLLTSYFSLGINKHPHHAANLSICHKVDYVLPTLRSPQGLKLMMRRCKVQEGIEWKKEDVGAKKLALLRAERDKEVCGYVCI